MTDNVLRVKIVDALLRNCYGCAHGGDTHIREPEAAYLADAVMAAIADDLASVGPCMAQLAPLLRSSPVIFCALRAGHTGAHECGMARWTDFSSGAL